MREWEEFISQQEERIGKEATDKWLRSFKVARFDAGNLYLQAADSFQASWFEEHMRAHAESSLRTRSNRKIRVHLEVGDTDSSSARPQGPPKGPYKPYELIFDQLDPYCTFSSFVSSGQNRLAHELLSRLVPSATDAEAVSLGTYNPIFIYGPSGVGKSHLLMATAHALAARGLRVVYARGATFTDHVVSAIRTGNMEMFRKAYRTADCLLLDDIQILSNKAATQEELFHTFNALHLSGKQLILAANCAPQELKAVEPRLVSRFEWGVTVQIEALVGEDLHKLVFKKCQAMNFSLDEGVIALLLTHWASEPKGLVQAIEALALRGHLRTGQRSRGANSHPGLARELLADLIAKSEKAAVTPERLIEGVASFYGLDPSELLGKSQRRECSFARQVSMYLLRDALNLPFTRIGDLFNRNHSTVMTSVKQVQTRIEAGDSELSAVLKRIRTSV